MGFDSNDAIVGFAVANPVPKFIFRLFQ